MTAQARPHTDTDRDIVVSVQDGNYRLVEVARVTPPVGAPGPRRVTVKFDRDATGQAQRPALLTIEFDSIAGHDHDWVDISRLEDVDIREMCVVVGCNEERTVPR